MCVTSVSFSVLINDQLFGLIKPQRGIRQGDPLSLFLFVLCTEGLCHLLEVAERNSLVEGMLFEASGTSIHHLFLADDSLFLIIASTAQCHNLNLILQFYGEATGQTINIQKSAISFGDQIPESERDAIQDILKIYNTGGTSKYQGLPKCFHWV